MAIKGLEQAVENLSRISRTAVPGAAAMAINRVCLLYTSIEGSVWPKSIRGSTPKVRGTCQIERAASESPHFMRFHVACPHCGEEQYLKFGDKETPFGLKWTPDDPSSVFYLCEHNACVIRQQELDFTDARYICEKTGIWTRDGILWFSSSGEEIEPPDSVTFHIWTCLLYTS